MQCHGEQHLALVWRQVSVDSHPHSLRDRGGLGLVLGQIERDVLGDRPRQRIGRHFTIAPGKTADRYGGGQYRKLVSPRRETTSSAAGEHLATLLHEHINTAVELVLAAKSGDTAGFDDAKARWYANGDEIADFLAAANPRFWPRGVMRDAMKMHLDQTLAEAAHRIAGSHVAEIADCEEVHAHILKMADLLSAGIMQQFPSRFNGAA